jgi:glutamine amidotransferase
MESYDALLIDAGTGNLHSVHHALLSLGFRILVTNRPDDLDQARRVILPGVGAFGRFMQGLRERDLVEPIQRTAQRGIPLLGICVGMQAMFELSEEMGKNDGLDLLAGKVVRFPPFSSLKVPHTGWNQLWFDQGSSLFRGMTPGSYVYFNHSYYCANAIAGDIAAYTDYGIDFCSAVQHGNLLGVQFHPEKSQKVGQQVLANFFQV